MAKKKTYVLDTNILLHNPHALLSFEDNDIVIPDVVIDELDQHKKDNGEVGANARQASRMLDKFRTDAENGNLLDGYQLPCGGKLRVEMNCIHTQVPDTWDKTADLRILRVCKGLNEAGHNIILVSNDSYVRIKASILGIQAQDFKTEKAPAPDDLYKGTREAYVSADDLNKFYETKQLTPSALLYFDDDWNKVEMPELTLHEYVMIKSTSNPKQSTIGLFDGNNIVPLLDEDMSPFGIKGRNASQKYIIDACSRPTDDAPLVIVKGPAGTGKTLIALAVGLEEVVENKKYKKILYLRGNTKLDEDIGFLPGTEQEKLDWALRPVRDNLEVIFTSGLEKDNKPVKNDTKGRRRNQFCDKDFLTDDAMLQDTIQEMFDRGYINIEAVAHMRGRSISNTYIIIDEAQNLTPKQIRTLLSRCSKDTKIVLLGDPYQIDHPYLDFRTNGLCYSADRMAGSVTTYQISLEQDDNERSLLSLEVSKRMADK